MRMQIKEFSALTGVSVRTLHYYDEIGLLRPSFVDERNGYRYYDEASLLRMQEILFYRELDFSLKCIQDMLSSPDENKARLLQKQKQLLVLKKERLERIIAAVEKAMKGEYVMEAFDNREYEAKRRQYAQEAKEKWGKTEAYAEYEMKSKGCSDSTQKQLAEGLDAVFAEFAVCLQGGAVPQDMEAQTLVKKLQTYISDHYYTCTGEILAGLGQMYVADERFRKNIDRHGPGTAAFAAAAIAAYCKSC